MWRPATALGSQRWAASTFTFARLQSDPADRVRAYPALCLRLRARNVPSTFTKTTTYGVVVVCVTQHVVDKRPLAVDNARTTCVGAMVSLAHHAQQVYLRISGVARRRRWMGDNPGAIQEA